MEALGFVFSILAGFVAGVILCNRFPFRFKKIIDSIMDLFKKDSGKKSPEDK